jgi:REP element-mobilizing transposase RayT
MTDHAVPHHRHSIRLLAYDYSQTGAYFVTICVKDREPTLGIVVDGNVLLSEVGKVVKAVWESLPVRFPGIVMDAFVVMPDHIHGIIIINDNANDASPGAAESVGAIHELPLRIRRRYQRRIMLLPKIIGYFKMNTAKRANIFRSTSGSAFWQRNYWACPERRRREYIIRDESDIDRVRRYIEDNPASAGFSMHYPLETD